MKARTITREDLKARLERGGTLTILDVRNQSDYQNSDVRLPGAVRIPVEELEARSGELDPSGEVVAYCT